MIFEAIESSWIKLSYIYEIPAVVSIESALFYLKIWHKYVRVIF